jgi:hypothetical protein
MRYEYKFVKHKGYTFFAHVWIHLLEATVDEVICGLPEKRGPNDHYLVTREIHPDWVDPAMEGLSTILRHYSQTPRPRYRVTLTKIVGSEVDSNSISMRCAAECCLWQALHPGRPLPEIKWVDSRWRLEIESQEVGSRA